MILHHLSLTLECFTFELILRNERCYILLARSGRFDSIRQIELIITFINFSLLAEEFASIYSFLHGIIGWIFIENVHCFLGFVWSEVRIGFLKTSEILSIDDLASLLNNAVRSQTASLFDTPFELLLIAVLNRIKSFVLLFLSQVPFTSFIEPLSDHKISVRHYTITIQIITRMWQELLPPILYHR